VQNRLVACAFAPVSVVHQLFQGGCSSNRNSAFNQQTDNFVLSVDAVLLKSELDDQKMVMKHM